MIVVSRRDLSIRVQTLKATSVSPSRTGLPRTGRNHATEPPLRSACQTGRFNLFKSAV